MKHISPFLAVTLALPALLTSNGAFANGYQDLHQSAQGLSTAYATNGTGGSDVSAIFSNPASLTRFPGSWMSMATTLILPRDTFENIQATAGATFVAPPGPAVTGYPTVPKQFLSTSVGAASYYTKQLQNNLFFAISINAPWATKSSYPIGGAQRYVATNTELTAYNVSPILAYKFNERISIGGGLNIQVYQADIATMVDSTGGVAPQPASDLQSRIKATNTAFGFNLGIEYQLAKSTRLGVSYRSAIVHKFNGKSNLSGDPQFLNAAVTALNLTSSTGKANFKINTPSILTFGIAHQATEKLELYGSAMLVGWKRFRSTTVQYSNGFPTTVVDNNWKNSWYVAGGLGYQISDALKVRTGIAFDWTPTPVSVRNPRAPNANRVYIGSGFTYQTDPSWKLDLSYAHCFFQDASIALAGGNNLPRGTLSGKIKIDAHIVMAQFTFNLDKFKFPSWK
jgi:long-chain fatty acid transport protein